MSFVLPNIVIRAVVDSVAIIANFRLLVYDLRGQF